MFTPSQRNAAYGLDFKVNAALEESISCLFVLWRRVNVERGDSSFRDESFGSGHINSVLYLFYDLQRSLSFALCTFDSDNPPFLTSWDEFRFIIFAHDCIEQCVGF
ncbi:hypothetical protein TNIN_379231 [Trichonephila inaurata madagascariensis]|uniref:Uncharacterized protein n=1 Tax=Trichonephila inaurata madagascariensis TaxID=2747483 RepID=A0A8X6JXM9_9ARAC|nr:hypothetical protein TNIN_379231 [Trichonephila inaurata madagascariensis]